MTFLEAIDKDLIKVPMTARNGKEAVEELVGLYAAKMGLQPSESEGILSSIMERESLGSTAMENGIAIPHAKISGLKNPAVMIGVSRIGIDFGGKQPSSIFFLVLAPSENPAEHIQILSSIAKVCSSDLFVRMLRSSKTKDDVYQLFFD
ncbi:MAG: PTS sugar transporter subunit IIA [Spirochaetes bacterium]|uniref:PTS sugar transporter subunit IIA n=1 Tax=Candidatus Ornithospirochaeta stercoripullorum TaxID=2840899 RepID=A0A9D9E047_9SPIO|nr:PTS sugar transporter subunit IIA [Candidatus Ornithospirochaeta stercoripullorum]